MNPADVRTLIDYHYWARDRMLDALEGLPPEQYAKDMGNSFRSIRDTVVHTFSAEFIWLLRWQGESQSGMLAPEAFPDVASIRTAWRDLETKLRAFFETLDGAGIERVIEYKSFAGQPMASVLWHMLQHVVNHASYHRGQVTTLLRQLGVAPPKAMDLIAFYRERGAPAP